jgi:hypothetical protein
MVDVIKVNGTELNDGGGPAVKSSMSLARHLVCRAGNKARHAREGNLARGNTLWRAAAIVQWAAHPSALLTLRLRRVLSQRLRHG